MTSCDLRSRHLRVFPDVFCQHGVSKHDQVPKNRTKHDGPDFRLEIHGLPNVYGLSPSRQVIVDMLTRPVHLPNLLKTLVLSHC